MGRDNLRAPLHYGNECINLQPSEMKINELRVGNLVGIKEGALHSDGCNTESTYFEIEELKKDVAHFKGFGVGEYYKDLKPVPITTKILLSLGFVDDNEKVRQKYKTFTCIHWRLEKPFFWVYQELDKSNQMIVDSLGREIGQFYIMANVNFVKKIDYVHELQNLYFALIGKDLNLAK